MKKMTSRLTDGEYKILDMLATGRHFVKDIVIPDRDMERWNNTQAEADLIGVIGEYVVAKYLNIPFDTSIGICGDGGSVDFCIGEWSCQVKSSKYSTARMVFNNKDEITALIYVLVIVDGLDYTISGYITRKDLLGKLYTKDLGHGIRYCIDQDMLSPISELQFYHAKYN